MISDYISRVSAVTLQLGGESISCLLSWFLTLRMIIDKAKGNKIIALNVDTIGFIQFIIPIYNEIYI